MIDNNDLFLFKSKTQAIASVSLGIFCVFTYKAWKIYIENYLGINPSDDYYLFQTYCTYYRIFATFLATAFLIKTLQNKLLLTLPGDRFVFIIGFSYLLSNFLLHIYFFDIQGFSYSHFIFELFFNFFTGSFEEFLFRGLIFIGIYQLVGLWPGMIISSFLFSIWHYDVVYNYADYIRLYLIGLIFSIALVCRVGIISLSIIHFALDQIHFGFLWMGDGGKNWMWVLVSFEALFFLLLASTIRPSSIISHRVNK